MNDRSIISLESVKTPKDLHNWADVMWRESGTVPVAFEYVDFDTFCRIHMIATTAEHIGPILGKAVMEIEFAKGLLVIINDDYGK